MLRVPAINLLLDSHVLLWWLEGGPSLSAEYRALIDDPRNEILVSSLSIAELQIKANLGKLDIPNDPIGVALTEEGFEELPFTAEHGDVLRDLPRLHRDPFDRMLIAQALVEDRVLVTADAAIRQYAVPKV